MSSRSKPGKRARTRARLIEIAFDLFLEQGIEATSLAEVAARAGMTKGAVYSSFRSKAELVIAVMLARPIELSPAFRPGMSRAEVHRAIGEAAVAMMRSVDQRARLVAEFHLYAVTHPAVRKPLSEAYARGFERATAQLAALNSVEPPAARRMVLAIQALTLGLAQQRMLTPDLVSDEDIVAAFEALT